MGMTESEYKADGFDEIVEVMEEDKAFVTIIRDIGKIILDRQSSISLRQMNKTDPDYTRYVILKDNNNIFSTCNPIHLKRWFSIWEKDPDDYQIHQYANSPNWFGRASDFYVMKDD